MVPVAISFRLLSLIVWGTGLSLSLQVPVIGCGYCAGGGESLDAKCAKKSAKFRDGFRGVTFASIALAAFPFALRL
jgi:hypothetical protein